MRRHFYGSCAIILGGWELAAYAKLLPTVTTTVHTHKRLHPLVAVWIGGLAVHLLCKGHV